MSHRRAAAFTLIELLVAMMLLSVIGIVLIGILSQSSALVSQGSNLIALHQRSRNAVDKISPILATAVVGDLGNQKAILIPSVQKNLAAADVEELDNDPTVYSDTLKFTTTEDLLNPAYDPRVWDGNHHVYEFQFILDDANDPNSLGKIELHKLLSTNGNHDVDTSLAPAVIAFNIQNFRCFLVSPNAVEVRIDTRGQRKGPQANMIEVVETQRAILSVPSGSY
jgi:hypothetical protein